MNPGLASIPSKFNGFRIGPLRLWALPQVRRLERTVFPEPLALGQLWHKFWQPEVHYLVAWDGYRVAAYFGFEVQGAAAHVISNATDPHYRRRGLGRFLLQAAENWARVAGGRYFLGEVRRSNRAQQLLLAQIGWVTVAEVTRLFGNGEDGFVVWRGLTSAGPATAAETRISPNLPRTGQNSPL